MRVLYPKMARMLPLWYSFGDECNIGLKYFLVIRAVTRVTYAIIDTIGLLGPDLQVSLASANAPLRILNNKGFIYLIICEW